MNNGGLSMQVNPESSEILKSHQMMGGFSFYK